MKKLYRKGTVHPSPPIISDHLSFLPAAILTLTVALSPQDREVLAYLISSNNSFSPANPRRTTTTTTTTNNNNNNNNNNKKAKVVVEGDHPPLFHCSCFRCYMSYWGRWDSSPNHQLIHEIIDAYEDWLTQTSKTTKTSRKKDKRNKRKSSAELKRPDSVGSPRAPPDESESVGEGETSKSGGGEDEVGEGGDVVEGDEKGSVRRFVSFIGERIWGAWGSN